MVEFDINLSPQETNYQKDTICCSSGGCRAVREDAAYWCDQGIQQSMAKSDCAC